MKRVYVLTAVITLLALAAPPALSWNLGARHINALRYEKSGRILFTLFDSGTSGAELQCQTNNQWFVISACPSNDAGCIASVNRMGSALLAAKLGGRPVHVQRSGCEVTEVALKP